jgi:hypothetical protein
MKSSITAMSGEEQNEQNNVLQALVLLEYLYGLEITAVTPGEIRYIAPRQDE